MIPTVPVLRHEFIGGRHVYTSCYAGLANYSRLGYCLYPICVGSFRGDQGLASALRAVKAEVKLEGCHYLGYSRELPRTPDILGDLG